MLLRGSRRPSGNDARTAPGTVVPDYVDGKGGKRDGTAAPAQLEAKKTDEARRLLLVKRRGPVSFAGEQARPSRIPGGRRRQIRRWRGGSAAGKAGA